MAASDSQELLRFQVWHRAEMTRLAEATEALKGHFEEQRGRDLEEIRKVGY